MIKIVVIIFKVDIDGYLIQASYQNHVLKKILNKIILEHNNSRRFINRIEFSNYVACSLLVNVCRHSIRTRVFRASIIRNPIIRTP